MFNLPGLPSLYVISIISCMNDISLMVNFMEFNIECHAQVLEWAQVW